MLKKQLKKQLKNNEGFTLAELLIVVAIIAILVAVSVPVFTGKLNESREATDNANLRAAKAAAVTGFLSEEVEAAEEYYYNAETGKLVGTKGEAGEAYGQLQSGTVIKVVVNASGEVTMTWE